MIERLVHEQAHQIHDVGGGGLIAAGICSGVISQKPKVKGPVDSRELQAPYFNLNSSAISGFQHFQTIPTRSGPGLRVGLPGFHPEGVTSSVSRTCWEALSWRVSSATWRPTGGVSTSMAWMMPFRVNEEVAPEIHPGGLVHAPSHLTCPISPRRPCRNPGKPSCRRAYPSSPLRG
jgi:hypothetical protein